MINMKQLNDDVENKATNVVDEGHVVPKILVDSEKQEDQMIDPFGTIAARILFEIEADESEADMSITLHEALSGSPVPLLTLTTKDMKLMYVKEREFSEGSCYYVDVLLTPYPFRHQSLMGISDSDLISEIDQDVTKRLMGCTADVGKIEEVRVLSIDRTPRLPDDLQKALVKYEDTVNAFDGSTGVLRLANHARHFEDALASHKDILEDGIHDATLEKVTIARDPRELDTWSALFTWRIEGKEGAAPHHVSGRWYYPCNPESDSRFHIFDLLRPWLGNDALENGDLDLHSLVGQRCKLLVIRSHRVEWYYSHVRCGMETPVWAVLPADFRMK